MKKKLIVAAGIVLAIVVGIILWFTVSSEKMIPYSEEEIVSVEITNGSTGDEIELSKEAISVLLASCEPIKCKYVILPSHGGWQYRVRIKGDASSRNIVFVSGQLVIIDGKDYRINSQQGDEVIKLIESFYTNQ